MPRAEEAIARLEAAERAMAGDWQVHENRYVQTGTKPLTERDVRANVEGAVALRNAAPALLAVARAALAAHPEPGFTRYSCNGALDSALADLADAVLGTEEQGRSTFVG